MPQPWFKYNGSKKVLISRLHSGFAAFAAEPSVTHPVGLQNAIMAEELGKGNSNSNSSSSFSRNMNRSSLSL